jgi:DNA-binding NarL/FixJ family response regulator
VNILIADDHQLVRDAIRELILKLEPDSRVETTASLGEAVKVLDAEPDFDVVLLDLYMPGMGGAAGAIGLLDRYPGKRIILMSGATSGYEVLKAIEAGLHGFIPKTLSGAGLVAAIRLVACGERYLPPDLLFAARTATDQLSERDLQLVTHLARGATNKAIAQAMGYDEVSIKGMVRSLGNRLGARTRTEIAIKALSLVDQAA